MVQLTQRWFCETFNERMTHKADNQFTVVDGKADNVGQFRFHTNY